jgi:urease accessory protein UreF
MFAERGALAQFLGLTPQELGEQIRSGKSLAEVAQGKGKSRDDLKTFLTNQAKTRFSAAVTAGRLTQAQADQMLAKMTANLDTMIDHKGQPGKGPRPGQNQGPARQRGTSA